MPDRAAVRRALSLFRGQADYVYFFSKLTSPGWVEPLAEEGRFASPPPAVREGNTIRFPAWPESEYLTRVAAKSPEIAARVLADVPATDNQRVHLDLVEVAIQLTPSDAAAWSRRELAWISAQDWLMPLLPEKLGELAAHLAAQGEPHAALELCKVLFSLRPDPRRESNEGNERAYFHPEPRGRMDGWEYMEATRRVVPALVEHGGIAALELFAGLLTEAIRMSSASDDHAPPVDYSFIWRDTIEEQTEHETDIRDILVDAVRDISVGAAERFGCEAVNAALLQQRWDIFRRIALHTLRLRCLAAPATVREALFTPGAFVDATIHHEYVLLLRDAFSTLPLEDQGIILGWIEEGPDREAMRERNKTLAGQEPAEEDVEVWVKHWQRDRLSPLKDVLPREWRVRFDELVREYGEPVFDFVQHKSSTSWGGERSPITKEELVSLSADERRRFLRDWIPTEGFREPSRSGVVQHLNALGEDFFVAEAEHANAWGDLHPAYVGALLGGFEKAVKAGRRLSWEPVFDLCDAVVAKTATEWDTRWAKLSVAALLITACDSEADVLPTSLRERVSDVVIRLLEEKPGAQSERVYAEADHLTAAINSVNGKALEAAIRAAVWTKRSEVGEEGNDQWRLADRMPRIAEALDRVIRPEGGFPIDARAIFGSHLGPLLWLDKNWIAEHREQLFPTAEDQEEYQTAVWSTYLAYGRPYTVVLELFSDQYGRSIDNLPAERKEGARRSDVAFRLAEHLMTYYWQGSLSLQERKGLLRRFFRGAGQKTRRYALEFVGRALRNSENVPPEALERLRALIEWRISVVRQTATSDLPAAAELQEFGWWFASAKFSPSWALETLVAILRLKSGIEPDHLVAEELLRLAEAFPLEVAEALRLMIEQNRPEFSVSGWSQEARQLLAVLGTIDNPAVKAMVSASVDTLLARGYLEYRDLMP